MKYYIIVLLFSILFSCDLSNNKELSVSKLVSDELETFNWKDVDTFPRFQNCDTIINRESNFNCFVNTLTSKIHANLINNDIVVYESITDTIMINFIVSNKGVMILEKSMNKTEILKVNLLVDSIFELTVLELPKLYPAIKRGQPVNTKFKLPILISTTE